MELAGWQGMWALVRKMRHHLITTVVKIRGEMRMCVVGEIRGSFLEEEDLQLKSENV